MTREIFHGIFFDLYRVELQIGGALHGKHVEVVRLSQPWWGHRTVSEHRNLARAKALKQATIKFPAAPISIEGWE